MIYLEPVKPNHYKKLIQKLWPISFGKTFFVNMEHPRRSSPIMDQKYKMHLTSYSNASESPKYTSHLITIMLMELLNEDITFYENP